MTASDRPSDRVVNQNANDLITAPLAAFGGADGGTPSQQPQSTASPASTNNEELNQRDLAIMAGLRELHYMTARQIERLHFVGHRSKHAAARASRRALRRLHDLGILYRLERRIGGVRAGSASYVYGLSPRGHRQLGGVSRRRSREPSLLHLQHVLAVAEVVVATAERVRLSASSRLVAVEGEPQCWRPYIAEHGGRRLLKPDLKLKVLAGPHELHWFVELDRGSEHRPVLRKKLRSYVGAWKDGSEQATTGVFPRVLWIVPDADRAEVLGSLVADEPALPQGMCAVTTGQRAARVLVGEVQP